MDERDDPVTAVDEPLRLRLRFVPLRGGRPEVKAGQRGRRDRRRPAGVEELEVLDMEPPS